MISLHRVQKILLAGDIFVRDKIQITVYQRKPGNVVFSVKGRSKAGKLPVTQYFEKLKHSILSPHRFWFIVVLRKVNAKT